MKKIAFLLLLPVSAFASDNIVRGTPVNLGDPLEKITVAVIGNSFGSTEYCSGSIIEEDVVVTAGHCANMAKKIVFGPNVAKSAVSRDVKDRATTFTWLHGFKDDISLLYFKGGLPEGTK